MCDIHVAVERIAHSAQKVNPKLLKYHISLHYLSHIFIWYKIISHHPIPPIYFELYQFNIAINRQLHNDTLIIYPLTFTVTIYSANGGGYSYLKAVIIEKTSHNRQTDKHRMARDSVVITSLCNGS